MGTVENLTHIIIAARPKPYYCTTASYVPLQVNSIFMPHMINRGYFQTSFGGFGGLGAKTESTSQSTTLKVFLTANASKLVAAVMSLPC